MEELKIFCALTCSIKKHNLLLWKLVSLDRCHAILNCVLNIYLLIDWFKKARDKERESSFASSLPRCPEQSQEAEILYKCSTWVAGNQVLRSYFKISFLKFFWGSSFVFWRLWFQLKNGQKKFLNFDRKNKQKRNSREEKMKSLSNYQYLYCLHLWI